MRRGNFHRAEWRNAAFVGAALAAALLIIAAFFDPKAAAAGWLVGFAFWAQILVGSLTLIMIHRLTSGRWGEIIAPAIAPAAATLPLLILLAVPLFIAMPKTLSVAAAAVRDQTRCTVILFERAVFRRTQRIGASWLVGAGAVAAARERTARPASRGARSGFPCARHFKRIDRLVSVARSAV